MGQLVNELKADIDVEVVKKGMCEICDRKQSSIVMIMKERNVVVFAHICDVCRQMDIEGPFQTDYVNKNLY